MVAKEIYDDSTLDYITRCNNRLGTMAKATMALLNSYMEIEKDSYLVAKAKVKDVSKAIKESNPTAKFDFMLGEPEFLIEAIEGIDEATYPHVTSVKKILVTNILSRA